MSEKPSGITFATTLGNAYIGAEPLLGVLMSGLCLCNSPLNYRPSLQLVLLFDLGKIVLVALANIRIPHLLHRQEISTALRTLLIYLMGVRRRRMTA